MAQQNVQSYIAEGFLEDCEELIYKLTEKFAKVDWHKFCYCWKQMEFDMLFYGRQSGPEVVELTEELLQTARLYIVSKTDNFESQVVGVFIAYAITIIQPYKNLCALRLVPADVPALKKIEAVARRENRRDILMILGQLYVTGKTQFHVTLREQAMDISIRKYFDGSINVPRDIARRWHGRLDRHRLNAIENIAQSESKYMEMKMKAKLLAESYYPDLNVKVDIAQCVARNMADTLQTLISGESIKEDDDVKHVSRIKARAMKNVVDPMKHLHGLTARQKANANKADAPESSSKSKLKSRSRCDKKLSSPNHAEGPCLGFSLPSLFDLPDGTVQGSRKSRESSPVSPFRGFKLNKTDMTTAGNTTNIVHKGKGVGKSSTNLQAGTSNSPAVPRTFSQHRSPNTVSKRKNSNNEDTTKKKKKKYKNKLNKKLRLNKDFNSDESNSDGYTSESLNTVPSPPSCKATPVTIQSKGVVKHFMQYEVSNIVLRKEETSLPDIEIEYIDNYKGANAYEEMCEVSDDEEVKREVNKLIELEKDLFNVEPKGDEVRFTIEECDEFGSTKDNDVYSVQQSVTETGDDGPCHSNNIHNVPCNSNSQQNEIDIRHFESSPADRDTVKKILSKNQTQSMERRTLKQPNLRSKLKKMGLLPVANFEDDSH